MLFKWSNFIWFILYGSSIYLVDKYKPFELNLYIAMVMYKFSERYISVIVYLLCVILGGTILIINIFVPEMLGDIGNLIIRTLNRYIRRLNPEIAEQINQLN
jgi:hypothetical protein